MWLLIFSLLFSNKQLYKSVIFVGIVFNTILILILQLHAQGFENNGTILTSNQPQSTAFHLDSNAVCSLECAKVSLEELLKDNDINIVCCWLISADESHKIYIDVNVTELLGKGSWAMVYDTYLHDDVK